MSGILIVLLLDGCGSGFDLKAASGRDGIGIRDMEERLALLEGYLEVHSRPIEGARLLPGCLLESPVNAG